MVSWTVAGALHAVLMAAILSWCTSIAWWLLRTWWKAKDFPGPSGWPIVGNAFSLYKDEETIFNVVIHAMESCGGIARLWIGPQLAILIGSAEDSRLVLNNPKVISRNTIVCHMMNGFIDRSLVSVKGEIARERRKMLTPAFHLKYLGTYFEVFARKAERLCGLLAGLADGRTVDIKDAVSISLLDAFFESFFGVDMEWPDNKLAQATSEIIEANYLLIRRTLQPWLVFDAMYALSAEGKRMAKIRENFKSFYYEGLAKNLKQKNSDDEKYDSSTEKVPCILDIIHESMANRDDKLTEEEICEECYFMAMAVVETTAKAMAYTLILLGMNPDCQDQAIEEQQEIFQNSLRLTTKDEIKIMPVLERSFKESMRLFPPIGGLTRDVSADLQITGGRVIPAGSTVLVSNFFVHRDAANYRDPERFWPDRWKEEYRGERHPHAYFPFGGGVRQCIGQKYSQIQLKVMLSRVLREFRFTCDYTMSDLRKLRINMSNVSVVGYNVKVYKRDM